VVALDGETCCDRVNHAQRRRLVQQRVADRRVWPRIDRDRKAGARTDAGLEATEAGTPHGGPWSPVRAHRWLDGRDTELARRGPRFVRDADEGNIDGQSVRAGQRVRARVTRGLARRLQWAGKAAQRAVDRPGRRTFRGCTVPGRRPHRRRVRDQALKAGTEEGRRWTCRTRGESLGRVVGDRRRDREGWYTDVGVAEAPSRCQALDSWRRRRWRGDRWTPWARHRSRQRRRRGVSRDRAGTTVKSAPGPWRIRRRPARAIARPGSSCDGLGWPRLHRGAHR
jgi:RNA-directed DNA polymerase